MTNNNEENPIDWMNRVVNSKSKTFCGAKWYNATIWLGNGMTASCHHPPPHQITPEEVKANHKALHNTHYKKLVRKEMQEGVQTRECEYCWKIEGIGDDMVSDRFYKSELYSEEDLQKAFDADWNEDIDLQTMEIAFDNNCNFACSYCNAGFSTTWAHDINKNGAYEDLLSEGWGAFAHNGGWAQPYGPKNIGNPYLEAFWKWWEGDLQKSLKQLRVTGGEATVSKDFWKLIDWYEAHPECRVGLGVNSNLGVKKSALDRLIESSHFIRDFELYSSNEASGAHAEYIRDGLVYDEWMTNLRRAYTEGNFSSVHIMMTLNALCLGSLDRFHEEIFDLRGNPGENLTLTVSYNILRFPSFQSITTLPESVRLERAEHYAKWLDENQFRMYQHEIHGMKRLIAYMEKVTEGHSVQELSSLETRERDFRNFYAQYDRRRGKNFVETFADWPELVEWYESIDTGVDHKREVPELIEANAVDWGSEIVEEVLKNHEQKD
jgi:hypothetical protein